MKNCVTFIQKVFMKVFLANNINSFFKNNIFLITQANAKVIPMHECRPTVAERSKALVLRSWMRKVVGSNPDVGLYRTASFSFAIDWRETATRLL